MSGEYNGAYAWRSFERKDTPIWLAESVCREESERASERPREEKREERERERKRGERRERERKRATETERERDGRGIPSAALAARSHRSEPSPLGLSSSRLPDGRPQISLKHDEFAVALLDVHGDEWMTMWMDLFCSAVYRYSVAGVQPRTVRLHTRQTDTHTHTHAHARTRTRTHARARTHKGESERERN
eukprot:COSAG03_NODE_5903_length_1151_cov_1.632129_2_plen_191_part_00